NPGDPSVIESPSAATITKRLVRARVRALRDQLWNPLVLAHDVVAVVAFHDALDVRYLVAGVHCELVRLRAQMLELGVSHLDALDARGIAALADQVERRRPEVEVLGECLDPLVDLAENGLVEADSLFTTRHVHLSRRSHTRRGGPRPRPPAARPPRGPRPSGSRSSGRESRRTP